MRSISEPRPQLIASLIAGGVGAAAFLYQLGPAALDPTNIDWLMAGDWATHLLGWLMFRHEEWTFPLGTVRGIFHPVGTTVGYTDSLPIAAILLKPLSGILPQAFQYIGPWLLLCFVWQGIAGALIVSAETSDVRLQATGGALFALSPVLYTRVGHDTLCAHFLLLLLIWLNFREERGSGPATALGAAALVVLTSAVHPTLWAMALVLFVALLARLSAVRKLRLPSAAALGVAVASLSLAVLWTLGYLGGARPGGESFGVYNADLLTLLNPMGFSRVLPAIPTRQWQYEGFGYLGLGAILLAIASAALGVRSGQALSSWIRRWQWPLVVACTLLAAFAAASVVTIAGREVIGLRSVYAPVAKLVEPFRSSGRFIWPLHYLVLALSIVWTIRFAPTRSTAVVALTAAVALQLIDLQRTPIGPRAGITWNALPSARWDDLARGRKHLVMFPPQMVSGGGGSCEGATAYPRDFYAAATWLAYRARMTINGGYVARTDPVRTAEYCGRLLADVAEGRWESDALYLVAPSKLSSFLGREGIHCEPVDGVWACVPAPLDVVQGSRP